MADDAQALKDELAQLLVEYRPLKQELNTLLNAEQSTDVDEFLRVEKHINQEVAKYLVIEKRIRKIVDILTEE
jgi:hypothetical protein